MSKDLPSKELYHTADYNRSAYHVTVDDDVSLSDIERPAWWCHHSAKLKANDLVDLVRADGAFDVQVRVTHVGTGFVKVRVLRKWVDEAFEKEQKAQAAAGAAKSGTTDDDVIPPLPEEYKITKGGKGWVVTFMPTDAKIAQGKKTVAEAVEAAKEHATQAGIAWPDATPAESTPGT